MLTVLSLADIVIGIEHTHSYIARQCAAYATKGAPVFTVAVTSEMISRERALVSQPSVSDGYCESIAAYREIARRLPAYDALLLHAAVIEVDGRAFAFTAKSGTGKSTHIRLWRSVYGERVGIVNGDKPILRFGEDGILRAYGTPWSGKEGWNRNIAVPLSSIVVLLRGETNRIVPLDRGTAVSHLLGQILLGEDADEVFSTLSVLDRVLEAVDTRLLYCTPTEEAARVAFSALVGCSND